MDKNKGELLERAYEGRVSRGHQYQNTVKFFPKYRNTVQNKLKIPSPTILDYINVDWFSNAFFLVIEVAATK